MQADPLARQPRRGEQVLEEAFEDELVLCNPEREQVVLLNEMGAAIWELCDGRRSLREIVAEIVRSLGADEGRVHEDVLRFLAELAGKGFLVLDDPCGDR